MDVIRFLKDHALFYVLFTSFLFLLTKKTVVLFHLMLSIQIYFLPSLSISQCLHTYIYGLNNHYAAFFIAECLKIKVKACALNQFLLNVQILLDFA